MPLVFPFEAVKQEYADKTRQLIRRLLQGEDAPAVKLINAKAPLVVRTLRPTDVGLNTPNWTFSVTAGEQVIINYSLDDKTMIVLLGVFNLSADPQVVELKIGNPAGPVEDVQLEQAYAFDAKILVFDRPIIASPGQTLQIKAVAKGDNTDERLGFIGFVIEPEGNNINVIG